MNPIRLCRSSLQALSGEVAVPAYDPAQIRPAIVHLGLGGFHRAHMARYTHELMNRDARALDWGIVGAGLLPDDARLARALAPQDWLYTLVERWSGGAWSASTTPIPRNASFAALQSVSCPSAARCLAVGDDGNPGVYADSWNGTGWHLVPMTTTGGRIGAFYAVSCLAATSCAAVAATTQFAASARSESAFWNGTRWKVVLTA